MRNPKAYSIPRLAAGAIVRLGVLALLALATLTSCPPAKALSLRPMPEPAATQADACQTLAYDAAIIMALRQKGYPPQTVFQAMRERRVYFQTPEGVEVLAAMVEASTLILAQATLAQQRRAVEDFAISIYDVCMAE